MKFHSFVSRYLIAGVLSGAASLGISAEARADVAWQHGGQVTVAGARVVNFNMRNEWSDDNHRLKLYADFSRLVPPAQRGFFPGALDLSIIERLEDDRLIVALPALESYIDEPYSTLPSRLRLRLWTGLDDELNEQTPPSLTPQQRERLGRELRASALPLSQAATRTFFRELPEERVINGLRSRGFRFTQMINTMAPSGQWMRVSGEWWLAEPQRGDDEIRDFSRRALALRSQSGVLSNSMWFNEALPVLWAASPPEAHQALASMIGRVGDGSFPFVGTPTQFFVTVTPPPGPRAREVRLSVRLTSREEGALDPALFAAPAGLERQPLEPFLRLAQNALDRFTEQRFVFADMIFGPGIR